MSRSSACEAQKLMMTTGCRAPGRGTASCTGSACSCGPGCRAGRRPRGCRSSASQTPKRREPAPAPAHVPATEERHRRCATRGRLMPGVQSAPAPRRRSTGQAGARGAHFGVQFIARQRARANNGIELRCPPPTVPRSRSQRPPPARGRAGPLPSTRETVTRIQLKLSFRDRWSDDQG